jgi:uncharacterized protein
MRRHRLPSAIEEILDKTSSIAVVGLSSRPSRPGYYVPSYLQKHGYRIVPVNPELDEALGERAYHDLLAVPEPIDLVLVFRRSEAVEPTVEQAIQVKAKAIWLQKGIINIQAAEIARAAGLLVVMDACMMVEHRKWARP